MLKAFVCQFDTTDFDYQKAELIFAETQEQAEVSWSKHCGDGYSPEIVKEILPTPNWKPKVHAPGQVHFCKDEQVLRSVGFYWEDDLSCDSCGIHFDSDKTGSCKCPDCGECANDFCEICEEQETEQNAI